MGKEVEKNIETIRFNDNGSSTISIKGTTTWLHQYGWKNFVNKKMAKRIFIIIIISLRLKKSKDFVNACQLNNKRPFVCLFYKMKWNKKNPWIIWKWQMNTNGRNSINILSMAIISGKKKDYHLVFSCWNFRCNPV